jgi:uncharacterized protein YegL
MSDRHTSRPDEDNKAGHETGELPTTEFQFVEDDASSETVDVPLVSPLGAAEPLVAHDFDDGELRVEIEPRFEWGSAPADSDPIMSVLLTLTPRGAPLVDRVDGPVAHLILALDVSASMNHADKYPVLTQALEGMLENLHSHADRDVLLSVIAFARGAEILFRGVPASQLTARDMIDAVDRSSLRFGRYTDLVGALSRAGRLAYDSHRSDASLPVRICVMTDGKPQDVEGAAAMMKRVGKMPVDVDALAFGADADVAVMQGLVSGHRGGTVKHVRTETLGEAYERVGAVARSVVSKRAMVSIDLASGVVGGSVYRFRPGRHAYGQDAFQSGVHFETDLGTLESGRAYSLLFEVRLPQTDSDDTEIGEVVLRVPDFGGPREFRCTLAIPRHADAATIQADPVVAEAREVLHALEDTDPGAMLRALRARRKLYISERRDPYLLEVVDKAIAELEERGTLDALSSNERAALTAHTATAGSSSKPARGKREYTFG